MSVIPDVLPEGNPPEDQEYIAPDEGLQTEFPGLYELLARILVKGVKRTPAKLIVYYEEGRCALCLSDKHTGLVAFHLADSLQEAMEGVERRLQAGKVDWRKSKKYQA